MHRHFIAVPLLALAALSLVACGDDEKSSGGGTRAATAVNGDAFCTQATKVDEQMGTMAAIFGDEPAASEAAITAIIDEQVKAEALAPTDIVDVVTTNIQGFRDIAAGLKKFDWDFAAASADPAISALLENPDLQANSDKLDAYLSDKCGIASS